VGFPSRYAARCEEKAVAAKKKPNKVVLAVIAAVHITVTALTWRDLRDRPAVAVRGSQMLWRVASALNTLGSAAYWVFGRRRPCGVAPREAIAGVQFGLDPRC